MATRVEGLLNTQVLWASVYGTSEGEIEASVSYLAHPSADVVDEIFRFQHSGVIPVRKDGRIAHIQEVDAIVIREENLTCMESGFRGKYPAAGSTGVVGEVRGIADGTVDQVVPGCVAPAGRDDEHFSSSLKGSGSRFDA